MAQTEVPVPIKLRTHERSQLREFVPTLIDGYSEHATEENNFNERVEELEDIHVDVKGLNGDERLFLTSDKWTTLLSSLTRLHNGTFNRPAWLQKKLHQRLEDQLEVLQ